MKKLVLLFDTLSCAGKLKLEFGYVLKMWKMVVPSLLLLFTRKNHRRIGLKSQPQRLCDWFLLTKTDKTKLNFKSYPRRHFSLIYSKEVKILWGFISFFARTTDEKSDSQLINLWNERQKAIQQWLMSPKSLDLPFVRHWQSAGKHIWIACPQYTESGRRRCIQIFTRFWTNDFPNIEYFSKISNFLHGNVFWEELLSRNLREEVWKSNLTLWNWFATKSAFLKSPKSLHSSKFVVAHCVVNSILKLGI